MTQTSVIQRIPAPSSFGFRPPRRSLGEGGSFLHASAFIYNDTGSRIDGQRVGTESRA